jgi:3-hydroxyisobutyrate dehydrogenase
MSHVAVLGMGLLGTGFAEGLLLRGGTTVTVWNRSSAKCEPLRALGADVATSPSEAVAKADRVHLVLLDDDSVDTTIDALRSALRPGAVIIDHTTTLPARTAARATALAADGVTYLHAPVMMGPGAARASQGLMLVAGPTAEVARLRDELAAMTGEVWHVGERSDLAASYKLFGNAATLSVVGVLADVMRMADAAGVDRAGVLAMLAKVNLNGPVGGRGAMMVSGEFVQNFTLDVARKDVRLMLKMASGAPTPMLSALAAAMDAGLEAGQGGEDFAVIGKR